MVKIKTMPKETLVELLMFLSENGKFSSVAEKLEGGMPVPLVRSALRELAMELGREVQQETGLDLEQAKASKGLSRKTKEIVSYLSPAEEKRLFTAFGFIEK